RLHRTDPAVERLRDRRNRGPGVGDQRVIRLVALVDLVLGDVDVDEQLVGEQVVTVIERRVLVKRVADRYDDLGLPERLPRAGMAAVGEYADRQRMAVRDDAI